MVLNNEKSGEEDPATLVLEMINDSNGVNGTGASKTGDVENDAEMADLKESLQTAEMDDVVVDGERKGKDSDDVVKGSKDRFVSPKDFDLLKVIGMGAFGKVIQVRNKSTKSVLAMKVISKRLLKRKEGYVENIQAERDILTRVRHPFVVNMHCSFQTSEKLFIIMDFLAGGELFLRLGREGIFLEGTAAFYLAEIILALDHLHGLGVLHRDLKPENILLGVDGHVCLTDFGLAKDLDEEDKALTICGTQEYMAPEMVAGQGYGKAADYWSLGCIAYEMLNGRPPFERQRGEGHKDLFRKIMKEKVKMPPGSTSAACKLLKGLLNRNVQARLGAARSSMFEVGGVAGLKQVDFFANIKWDKLEQKDIEPPELFAVQNEQDLQHFHDEFTSMPLPRSVVVMSQPHYQPRRVDSDAFRGFSFVQENFVLPDRDASEIESYWNSVDGDAESLSECASSKFGDDDPIIEVVDSDLPKKKKRPPRKRKKKNVVVAVTAASVASSVSPVPSRAASPTVDEAVKAPDEIKLSVDDVPKAVGLLAERMESTVVSTPEVTSVEVKQPLPKAKPRKEEVWQTTSVTKKNKSQTKKQQTLAGQPATSSRPVVGVVGGAGWKKPQQHAPRPNDVGWKQEPHNVQGVVGSGSWKPPASAGGTWKPAQPSGRPVASDWRQHTSPHLQPRELRQPPSSGIGNAPPPPSDWRTHSSPRISPQMKAAARGQSLQSESSSAPAWPSLDPALSKKEVKPVSLKGAWGARATK